LGVGQSREKRVKYALGEPSVGRVAIPFAFKGELAESRRVDLLPLNLWLQRHPVRFENIEIMSALPSPAQADKQIFGKSGPVTRGKAARLRSILWFITRITVTCACLWRVGRMVDVQALRTILTTISMPLLSLSFVFFLLMAVLGGLRWWVVFRAIGHSAQLGALISMFWIGSALNQIMPSAAGDTVRVWLSVRRGYQLRSTVNSIVLDRVFMLATLLVIALATQPLLARIVPEAEHLWIAAAFAVVGLGGIGILTIGDLFPRRFVDWKPVRWLSALSTDTRRVVVSSWGAPSAVLCVLSNLNFVMAGALLGAALGLRVDATTYLACIPLVVAVTVIPISIAGWGLREGLLVSLLSDAGIRPDAALAFSLMFGLLSAACSLPGVALWCLRSERVTAVLS
jgi:uncharacterized membrane protein YbhN (UPF0104 family)